MWKCDSYSNMLNNFLFYEKRHAKVKTNNSFAADTHVYFQDYLNYF